MKISKGFLFSLITMIFWAFAIVNTRFLLIKGENALNLTTWILMFTFIPWFFVTAKHAKELKRLSGKNILLLIFIGIAGSIGINYLQSLSLQYSTAANYAFLYRTIVIFTIILAWIFFKEKITRKKLILVVLILIGSYLLTTNGKGLVLSKGDIYTLVMAASAAFISNILVKYLVSKIHPDLSGALATIVSIITLLIFTVITKVFSIPKNLLMVIVGSCLFFIQILLRNRAYQSATASFVTMIFSLTPFFVTIISFVFLHEIIEPIQLIGGIIIVGSTFFVDKFKI